MKKFVKGSFTIEASVIVPVILTVFSLIITMLFYYHDKNVVSAIVHETLVMGCNREEITEEEIEKHFHKRLGRKMLLFQNVHVATEIEQDEIGITCTAKKKSMSLCIDMMMKRTNPEKYIWNLQRIQGGID